MRPAISSWRRRSGVIACALAGLFSLSSPGLLQAGPASEAPPAVAPAAGPLPAPELVPPAVPGASAPATPGQPGGPGCPPAAVEPTPEDMRQGLLAARDHGLLWRVRRDGRSSWLYGTVHVAQREWMYPGPSVMNALRESREVALELDLMDPAIGDRLGQLSRQPADAAPLPAALGERLAKAEAKACMGTALQGVRPELRAATLTALALRDEGLDPSWGIDNFLAGLARGLNKPVRSLETPERQMKLLLGEDAEARGLIVSQALDELEQGQSQRTMRRLANAWQAGDFETLVSYPQWCDCLSTPEQKRAMRRLLDERNVAMAASITRLHQRARNVFVAVGSLHMIGPHGLPALLTARGFEVERVRMHPAPAAAASSSTAKPSASAAPATAAR